MDNKTKIIIGVSAVAVIGLTYVILMPQKKIVSVTPVPAPVTPPPIASAATPTTTIQKLITYVTQIFSSMTAPKPATTG